MKHSILGLRTWDGGLPGAWREIESEAHPHLQPCPSVPLSPEHSFLIVFFSCFIFLLHFVYLKGGVHVWREVEVQEPPFSFHHVGPRIKLRPNGKGLYP